jgi:oligosaccharyltransferase complex subunit beta
MRLGWILCLLGTLVGLCLGQPVDSRGRTLVIVDDSVDQDEWRGFFNDLRARGHNALEIRDVHDEEYELIQYDARVYDNLILLPTGKVRSLGPRLTSHILLDFFGKGGNILSVTSPKAVPESVREFSAELDIHIGPRGYKMVDHFNYEGDGTSHDSFSFGPEEVSSDAKNIFNLENSIKVSGANGAYLGNSELVIPLIHGKDTSYVYDSRDEDDVVKTPWVSGSQGYIAAALQGNNNARFLWIGAKELLQDKALSAELTKWAFQEKNVIRPTLFEHHLVGSEEKNERIYKVNEELSFSTGLSEWDGEKWVPYHADDVQLEFVMLDPYYRLNLERVEDVHDSAIYTKTFMIPDQYGMFTFRVVYRRPGLSFVDQEDVVTIRHIANDEWPRSWNITNSWVYLTSAVSVVIAWFVFTLLYLYAKDSNKDDEKKNK